MSGHPWISTWQETSLPTPKPIGEATLDDLKTAWEIAKKLWHWTDDYNQCTCNFESQRNDCKDNSCNERLNLVWEIKEESDISKKLIEAFSWYVENTNKNILAWWESAVKEELDWYLTAFWDENWSWWFTAKAAYLWASSILESSTLEKAVSDISSIKESWKPYQVKLLHLTTVITRIWKAAWASSELETAQKKAVWDILTAVIESGNWDLAIEFINTQVELWEFSPEMYTPEVIQLLSESTLKNDISQIKDESVKKRVIQKRVEKIWDVFLDQMKNTYWEGPVIRVLEAVVKTIPSMKNMEVSASDIRWQFKGINWLIRQQNEKNGTNHPEISIQGQDEIINIFTLSMSSEKFSQALEKITHVTAKIQEISGSIQILQDEVSRLEWMGEFEESQKVQGEIAKLYWELSQLQRKKSKLESDLEANIENMKSMSWSLSGLRYDFSSAELVKQFDKHPEYVKLISNQKDLINYLKQSEKTIPISDIHRSLRWDLSVLRHVKNLNSSEVMYIPESYFILAQADWAWKAHAKIFVLLNNTNANPTGIMRRFLSLNTWKEYAITEAVYHILKDSELPEYRKKQLKKYVENSPIWLIMSPDEQKELGIVFQLEKNENTFRELFESRFRDMRLHNNQPQDWDQKIFKWYLELYWYNDVKSQFLSLIRNNSISFDTIESIIPSIQYDAEIMQWEVILEWIKHRGYDFCIQLSDSYKWNFLVIKEWLKSCDTIWQKQRFLWTCNIDTPTKLLAVYDGLNGNMQDLKEIFWDDITSWELKQLSAQIDPRWETNESKRLNTIIEAIGKKQQEQDMIERWLQDVISKNNEAVSTWNQEQYTQEIMNIIESHDFSENDSLALQKEISKILWNNIPGWSNVIYIQIHSILSKAYRGETTENRAQKIEEFITSIQKIELKKTQDKWRQAAKSIKENTSSYPLAYIKEILENEHNIEANEYIKMIYTNYINNNLDDFKSDPYSAQHDFLTAFLEKYNFNDPSLIEQRNQVIILINSTASAAFIKYKINNPSLFRKAIEGGSEWIANFWMQMWSNLWTKAQKDVENYKNIELPIVSSPTNDKTGYSRAMSKSNTLNEIPNLYSPIMQRVTEWHNWEYIFSSSEWEIPVTMNDINALNNNPEAEVNLIHLYSNFQETWLERLWKHKDAIFKVLWNNWGLKFNSQDGWYVDTREANELFSTILYTTTQNPNYKETGLSLEETKAAIIRETHWFAGETNVEATWEQGNKLEKSFIDRFTMRNQGDEWKFKPDAFEKALKWNFSEK